MSKTLLALIQLSPLIQLVRAHTCRLFEFQRPVNKSTRHYT